MLMLRTKDFGISRIFNSKVDFIALDTALIPLLFTNDRVNKPPDISVSVKPLAYPRYVSNIKCSSADGVGMYDVRTKFCENWPITL